MANFDTTTTFPAGVYYIGDPCYVMHNEWSEICNDFFFVNRQDHGVNDGEYTLKDGRRIFVGSTAYGDGTYSLSDGGSVGVDAGCIGLVLLSDIDTTYPGNDPELGEIREFTEEFTVSMVDRGVFQFGEIGIDTADWDYEEEDEWDDDSEDETETW